MRRHTSAGVAAIVAVASFGSESLRARGLIAMGALAVGLGLVPVGGAGAAARASDVTDVYPDPAGDVPSATIVPDIAQVTLTSAADGTVAFDIRLAANNDLHSAPPERGLSWIFVAIDSDRNSATGGDWGDFVAYQIGPSRFAFRRWDGSAYVDFPRHDMAQHFNGSDLAFTLALGDIGANGFDFWVTGGNLGDTDRAPNNGSYAYPPTISSLVVPALLLRPKAGRIYRIQGITARISNETTASPDALSCILAYHGAPLRSLAGGCAWKIAKRYRGKTLRLALAATYRGASATFDFVVRPR